MLTYLETPFHTAEEIDHAVYTSCPGDRIHLQLSPAGVPLEETGVLEGSDSKMLACLGSTMT